MKEMKDIRNLLIFITMITLALIVIFPKNLGERTPIWDVKKRFFGDEYGELRSKYFINFNKYKETWHGQEGILNFWNDHDSFTLKEIYLKVGEEIAKNCKIKTSGTIEWTRYDLHVLILADALTDEPLIIKKGPVEYSLDQTEDSIHEFEAATGIEAEELLDTVALIRREYREKLNAISEMEYQAICASMKKTIIKLMIMWGIYVLIWEMIRIAEKRYEKSMDDSMKDFIQ